MLNCSSDRIIATLVEIVTQAIDEQMDGLIKELAGEFAVELRQRDGKCNRQAAIDSIDWRSRAISGTPLTDGYHFAQTLTNDYGRPYGSGANIYTGISGRAAFGPPVTVNRPARVAPQILIADAPGGGS